MSRETLINIINPENELLALVDSDAFNIDMFNHYLEDEIVRVSGIIAGLRDRNLQAMDGDYYQNQLDCLARLKSHLTYRGLNEFVDEKVAQLREAAATAEPCNQTDYSRLNVKVEKWRMVADKINKFVPQE